MKTCAIVSEVHRDVANMVSDIHRNVLESREGANDQHQSVCHLCSIPLPNE